MVSSPRRPVLNVGPSRFATRRDLVALFFPVRLPEFSHINIEIGGVGGHEHDAICILSFDVCGSKCCTLFSATRSKIRVNLYLWGRGRRILD